MAEKGQVTELKENLAVVRMTRTEACAKCRACIAGMKEQDMFIEAENLCEASPNDWVEVELADNGFLSAVMIMYGIPFAALMAGILIGYFALPLALPFVNRDLGSCLLGVIFTAVSYLWIRSKEDKWRSKKYRPIAVRKADAPLPSK